MKVAVIEDDPRFRSTLETFLRHASGFEPAASFGAAEPALRAARRQAETDESPPWGLVLMDLELPGIDGIQATRELKRLWPSMPVVMLTAFEEAGSILQAICAGADGYLIKKVSARELLQQLQAIVAGGSPLTAGVARTVLQLLRSSEGGVASLAALDAKPPPSRLDLTQREQDVLRCLVRGMSYQRTADELGIGLDTVRGYIRAVYRKLQVHSVAEAVGRAIRERLV